MRAPVVAELAAWTGSCFVVWLVTMSSITWQDCTLGAGGSLLAAGCAVVGRRLTRDTWRARALWLRWLVVLPIAVVADTVTVLAQAYGLRRRAESNRSYRLPDDEDAVTSDTRAALGALALSAAPSSYVVDTEREARVMHVKTAGTVAPAWAQVNPTEP